MMVSGLMAYCQKTPELSFSMEPGFYHDSIDVAISCSQKRASIFYTLNGSEPVASRSARYSSPLRIKSTTVLRAIAVSGSDTSRVESATYFIDCRDINLPIVSLITDSANLFNDSCGIYVRGTNGIDTLGSDGPANWNQDWERPVHFEYFDTSGHLQVSQDAGIKIGGGWSRREDIKPLKIIARGQYGKSRFSYRFFSDKDISEFKTIVLRNGGNDVYETMMRDAVASQFCMHNLDVETMACSPVVVFLDGHYWGIRNLREKMGKHYFEENFGLKAKDIDLLEMQSRVLIGSADGYNNLLELSRDLDMNNPEEYHQLADQIDMSNYIDYWIAETFFGNDDWPGNNIRFWRPHREGGKWRWILFDLDYAFGFKSGDARYNSLFKALSPELNTFRKTPWACELFNNLLMSPDFRADFAQRYSYHIQHTFLPERLDSVIDIYRKLYAPEWEHHREICPKVVDSSEWEISLHVISEWIKTRHTFVQGHVRNTLNLGPAHRVMFCSQCPNVQYYLNDYKARGDISGFYFSGQKLRIRADLPSGVTFSHWNLSTYGYGLSQDVYDPELVLDPTKDYTVRLVVK